MKTFDILAFLKKNIVVILSLVVLVLIVKIFFFPPDNDASLRRLTKQHKAVVDSLNSVIKEKDVLLELEIIERELAYGKIDSITIEKNKLQKEYVKTAKDYEKFRKSFNNLTTSQWDSVFTKWYPAPGQRVISLPTSMESRDDGGGYN